MQPPFLEGDAHQRRGLPQQRDERSRLSSTTSTNYVSPSAACKAIAPKLGAGVESLRTETRQALRDADTTPGVTTAEQQRIKPRT